MALPDTSAVLDEPACGHNKGKSDREKKAGCPKPKPGSAAGGCAFDGAMITLVPVADVAHVVHGPIACCGNSWDSRGSLSSGPDLYRRGFTTDVSEHDVVFGGERKLHDTIVEVAHRYRPAAVFAYATCVPSLIGDDLQATCRAAAAEAGVPVVPIDAPGFVGSKNLGNRIAGQAILDHVVGTGEPPETTPYDICLVGEYNIAGELWEVVPLFERLGVRLLSCISGDARYAELTWAHRARATMVVCSKALINIARGLEERYGIPWFEGSFYGVRDMGDALRRIAGLLGDPDLVRRAEELIVKEEAAADAALAPYRERLAGKRAVLYTGGVKSWSVVSALQDVGVQVVATGVTKSTEEDIERIRDLLGIEGTLIEEGNPQGLLDLVRSSDADILIAGGRNLYTAIKGRVPFLDINQEREHSYTGYAGIVELARRLDLAMSNPVWDQVRRPAPWDGA
jgi:nitrogenase molybdenum-cofactor synthesis protein NifE